MTFIVLELKDSHSVGVRAHAAYVVSDVKLTTCCSGTTYLVRLPAGS